LKEKYNEIIQENLDIFEDELKELKTQFYSLRVMILNKDNMIRKLFQVLSSQELYLVNFKHSLGNSVDFGSLTAPYKISAGFSPKRGFISRVTSHNVLDNFTDRAKAAGMVFNEPPQKEVVENIEKVIFNLNTVFILLSIEKIYRS